MTAIARLSVLILALAAACTQSTSSSSEYGEWGGDWSGEAGPKEPALVRTQVLARGPVEEFVEFSAVASTEADIAVTARISGHVAEIAAEEGDRVAKDQILCRLEAREIRLAFELTEIALREAENAQQAAAMAADEAETARVQANRNAEQARRDHDRNTQMAARTQPGQPGVLSEKALEDSLLAAQQAESAAETARRAVSRASLDRSAADIAVEKARVSRDRESVNLEWTEIRAPINGVVAKREVALGDKVEPQGLCFQIVDPSSMQAVFHRPQRELISLRAGLAMTARTEAVPGRTFGGRVLRVAPVVEQESGTVRVTAAIDDTAGLLRPGMLLRLKLTFAVRQDTLLCPKKAVRYDPAGEAVVYAVREGQAVELHPKLGVSVGESWEIADGRGLAAGDAVIVVGPEELEDGRAVRLPEDDGAVTSE